MAHAPSAEPARVITHPAARGSCSPLLARARACTPWCRFARIAHPEVLTALLADVASSGSLPC